MLYLLGDKNFYTRAEAMQLFNNVNAIKSNTNGYFDTMKYPELMYAFYLYAPFDQSKDWEVAAGMLERKLGTFIKSRTVDVSFLCKKIFGKDIPQISGKNSIIGLWKVYLQTSKSQNT